MKHSFVINGKKYSMEAGCSFPGKRQDRRCNGDCGNCKYGFATMQLGELADLLNPLIKGSAGGSQ